MLKRGYQGVYHQFSEHLHRYVGEFRRHNDRPLNTVDQMAEIVRGSSDDGYGIRT